MGPCDSFCWTVHFTQGDDEIATPHKDSAPDRSGAGNSGRCEEAVHKIAGSETGAHGLERSEKRDEVGSVVCGKRPQALVFNYFESDVPSLGAIFVENFAMRDLKAIRSK